MLWDIPQCLPDAVASIDRTWPALCGTAPAQDKPRLSPMTLIDMLLTAGPARTPKAVVASTDTMRSIHSRIHSRCDDPASKAHVSA